MADDKDVDAQAEELGGGDSLDQVLGDAIDDAMDSIDGLPGDDGNDEDDESPRASKRADDDEDDDEPEGDENDDEDVDDDQDEDDESDDDSDVDEDDDDELAEAWDVLRGARVPLSVLKRTSRDTLIAWGKQVAQEMAESGHAAGDSQDDSDDADGPAAGKAGSDSGAARQSLPDWSELGPRIADQLGVEPEAVDSAFKPFFEAHQSVIAEVKALRTHVEQAAANARAQAGQATIDSQIGRLKRRYPELKHHAEARQKVVDEAVTLAEGLRKRGKPIDAQSLFDRAAMLALGKAKRSDIGQLRRNGMSSPPRRGGSPFDMQLSDEDSYWAKALDHVDRGRPELAARLQPPKPKERRDRRRQ